jgi:hypothetical protein
MKRLLFILLLVAGNAYGQINNPPTSVNIVDSTATGRAVLTATNAAAARSAIGINSVTSLDVQSLSVGTYVFPSVTNQPITGYSAESIVLGTNSGSFTIDVAESSSKRLWINSDPSQQGSVYISGIEGIGFDGTNSASAQAATRTNLGLGATNNVTFSNITASGTLAVSNTATFATNVTVAGSLSVGSFTTTTPSTWALDATQTAAATNGVLTLPSNANVIRLTNNNAISSVTNGVLGAFYYLVNQATNAVTISNVGGITIDGAQNLTLSPNESATLVATGPTNVSVAARGDLTDVALGGTANTAPSQTASSGSSLMTRDLLYPAATDDASGDLVFPGAFVSSGTGALAQAQATAGNIARVTTNTNTMAGAYFADSFWTHNGFSGGSIPSGKVLDLALKGVILRVETNQNYVLRVAVGVGTPTRTPPPAGSDALSARGWGVNFFYNGTNYVYQPFWYTTNYNTGPAVALSNMSTAYSQWTDSVFTMRLRQETNGDIKFWINNGLNSRLGATPSFQTNVTWGAATFGGRSLAIEAAAATNAAPAAEARIGYRVGYLKYEQ